MTVFSIFNIGTGHTSAESNNIMKMLYDQCSGPKFINDGPIGGAALTGAGMTEKKLETLKAVEQARDKYGRIDCVNLTGHSRGAILCHMIAHDILTKTHIPIPAVNMFVIDPVHQSRETGHAGADRLVSNSKLKSYHAMIMENVNKRIYPVTLIDADDDETAAKRYFIPMPGTHGSATQVLTNPIAKVAYELIANFMQKRGTDLEHRRKSAEDMCELFAQIHLQNPLNAKGKRLIFDDPDVTEHVAGNEVYQPIKRRRDTLDTIREYNEVHARSRVKYSSLHEIPYFFNQKHAKFFKKAYPDLWSCILGLRKWDRICAVQEVRLKTYFAMRETYHLVEPHIKAG